MTRKTHLPKILLLAFLFFGACAHNGSVTEKEPLKASLNEYRSLALVVYATNPNAKKYVKNMKVILSNAIRAKKVFDEIHLAEEKPRGADIALKVNIVGIDEGDKLARTFNVGGDSEFKLEVEIIQLKGRRSLASLDVTGNSKKGATMKVGGFDTSMGGAFDDLTEKAMMAASQRVADYLAKHAK